MAANKYMYKMAESDRMALFASIEDKIKAMVPKTIDGHEVYNLVSGPYFRDVSKRKNDIVTLATWLSGKLDGVDKKVGEKRIGKIIERILENSALDNGVTFMVKKVNVEKYNHKPNVVHFYFTIWAVIPHSLLEIEYYEGKLVEPVSDNTMKVRNWLKERHLYAYYTDKLARGASVKTSINNTDDLEALKEFIKDIPETKISEVGDHYRVIVKS